MLRIFLLSSIFTLSCSVELFINQNYEGASSSGTSSEPYKTLFDAFSAIESTYNSELQHSSITFILQGNGGSSTAQPYTAGIQAIGVGTNTYFLITGDSSAPVEDEVSCSSLPPLEFSNSSSILITTADLLTSPQPDSAFTIQSLHLFIRASAESKTYLSVESSYYTITLQHVCITEEIASFLPVPAQFISFNGIPTVHLNNLILLSQAFTAFLFENISMLANLTDIAVEMNTLPTDLSSIKTQSLFSITSSDPLSQTAITNVSISCNSADAFGCQLSSLLNISSQLSVNITSLSISNSNITLISDFVAISQVTLLSMQNMNISNVNLTTRVSPLESSMLFVLQNSVNYSFMDVYIGYSNFSYIDVPQEGYPFDIFYISTEHANPTLVFTNLEIMETNFDKAFNMIVNIDIDTRFESIDISQVTVRNSLMNIRAIFRVVVPSSNELPDIIVWREVSDFYIANSTFLYCYIFLIDSDVFRVNITEKEFYNLSNFHLEENIFDVNEEETGDTFICTRGAFLKVITFIFVRNQVISHDGIGVQVNPSNFVFIDVIIHDNYFEWAYFYRNSVLTDPSITYSLDPGFYVPSDPDDPDANPWVKRMSRVFYAQNLSMVNNEWTSYSVFVLVSGPIVAFYNCTFIRNKFITAKDGLLIVQPYYPVFLGTSYKGYITDPDTETKIYSTVPMILKLLNGQTPGSEGIPSDQFYRYIFENVIFDTLDMGDGVNALVFSQLNFECCGIHFFDTSFSNITTNSTAYYSVLISANQVPYLRVENCSFTNLNNYGVLLNIENFVFDSTFIFNGNIVDGLGDQAMIKLDSATLNQTQISNNLISNIVASQSLIQCTVQVLAHAFEFSQNFVHDVAIYSSDKATVAVYLLQVQVQTAQGGENTIQTYANCSFVNIYMEVNNELLSEVFSNSLLLIVNAQGQFSMTGFNFQNVSILNADSIIKVSSSTILIDQSQFDTINISGFSAAVTMIFQTASLSNSNFVNFPLPSLVGGPLINLADALVSSEPKTKEFSMSNCTFQDISYQTASVLQAEFQQLDFALQNCSFQDVFVIGDEAAGIMYFSKVNFTAFKFDSVTITYSKEPEDDRYGSFFYLSGCQGINNATVSISDVFFDLNFGLAGVFLYSTEAVSLPIALHNFHFALEESEAKREELLKISYQIVEMLSGQLTLSDSVFENFGSTQNLFLLHCANGVGVNFSVERSSFSNMYLSSDYDSGGSVSIIKLDAPWYPSYCVHQISINSSNFSGIESTGNGTILQDTLYFPDDIDLTYFPTDAPPPVVSLRLEESSFTENKAVFGGVLYSIANNPKNTNITVSRSNFLRNNATAEGGVFWVGDPSMTIVDSTFTQNTAEVNGGVVFISQKDNLGPIFTSTAGNTFTNNTSELGFGWSAGSPPQSITLEIDHAALATNGIQLALPEARNVSTNGFSNVPIIVYLRDQFDNLYNDDSAQKVVSVIVNSSFQYRVFYYKNCTKATCWVTPDDLQITGKAGENVTLRVEYQSNVITASQELYLIVRGCVEGEINDTSIGTCTLCPSGKYSLNVYDSYCKICMEGATCLGGNVIQLHSGWWRQNASSDQLVKCPQTTCIGGVGEDICADGYTGILCLQCDQSNGYMRKTGGGCVRCPQETAAQRVGLVFSVIGLSLYQLLIAFMTFNSNTSFNESFKQTGVKIIKIGQCVAVFTNYSQITSVVFSLSSALQDYLSVANSFGDPYQIMFLSLDCIFFNGGYSAFQILQFKILISSLTPLLKWIIFSIVLYPLTGAIKKKSSNYKHFQFSIILFLSLFLLEQPGIVKQLLAVFNCNQLDPSSATLYNVDNADINCSLPEYNSFKITTVLPILLTWGVFIPFLIFGMMIKNKRKLKSENYRIVLGGFYIQYTEPAYYWGLVSLGFKEVLLIVSNFFSEDEDTKLILCLVVMVLYFWMLRASRPFHHSKLYDLEVYSTICCCWSSLLILLIKYSKTPAVTLIATYLLMVINVLMVFYFVLKMTELVLHAFSKFQLSLLRFVRKIYSSAALDKQIQELETKIANAAITINMPTTAHFQRRNGVRERNRAAVERLRRCTVSDQQELSTNTPLPINNAKSLITGNFEDSRNMDSSNLNSSNQSILKSQIDLEKEPNKQTLPRLSSSILDASAYVSKIY